jgi:hypothetical protein
MAGGGSGDAGGTRLLCASVSAHQRLSRSRVVVVGRDCSRAVVVTGSFAESQKCRLL